MQGVERAKDLLRIYVDSTGSYDREWSRRYGKTRANEMLITEGKQFLADAKEHIDSDENAPPKLKELADTSIADAKDKKDWNDVWTIIRDLMVEADKEVEARIKASLNKESTVGKTQHGSTRSRKRRGRKTRRYSRRR